MADCCAPLWSGTSHIKLVDPHFDASTRRFKRPFVEFVRRVRAGTTVDVFRGDQIGAEFYVSAIQRALEELRRTDIVLRLFVRQQTAMHNRFILSSAGGISFQIGLDEDATGERPEDIVTVLQSDVWLKEWETYTDEDCLARLTL